MKVWNSICLGLVSVAGVLAAEPYAISEGSIAVGEDKVSIGEINTAQLQQLALESTKDDIEIELELADFDDARPHQLVVNLGLGELYASYVPKIKGTTVLLTIPGAKIPEVLKTKDYLELEVIAASYDVSRNFRRKLGVKIVPSDDFKKTSTYVNKSTIGIKPEIHHIFRSDPATVNAIVPVVFIGAALVLFFMLVVSWGTLIGKDLFSLRVSGVQLLINVTFLLSLVGLEVTFIKYYLGQSIFTTLYFSGGFGLLSVIFGSRTLKWLSKNRRLGRA